MKGGYFAMFKNTTKQYKVYQKRDLSGFDPARYRFPVA